MARASRVDFVQRQPHRHPHEEGLRHLDALFLDVQEVTVVQRLQTQVVELQVTAGVEGRAKAFQVELQQALVEQFGFDAALDVARQIGGIAFGHLRLRDLGIEDLAADGVQQQPRGGTGVGGLLLDQRARRHDRGLVDLVERDPVIQVAAGFGQDGLGLDVVAQAGAGRFDQLAQRRHVQRDALTVVGDVQLRRLRVHRRDVARTLLRAALAVQHVRPRDLVMATAHQRQFDVVLHVLDVEGATSRA